MGRPLVLKVLGLVMLTGEHPVLTLAGRKARHAGDVAVESVALGSPPLVSTAQIASVLGDCAEEIISVEPAELGGQSQGR